MYRLQFHNLLVCCKLFSCLANCPNYYNASKERGHSELSVSATQRHLPAVDDREIRSSSMERREIIRLARITLLNPAEKTETHSRIIAFSYHSCISASFKSVRIADNISFNIRRWLRFACI